MRLTLCRYLVWTALLERTGLCDMTVLHMVNLNLEFFTSPQVFLQYTVNIAI